MSESEAAAAAAAAETASAVAASKQAIRANPNESGAPRFVHPG